MTPHHAAGKAEERPARISRSTPVVYYVRTGDRIKIGFTASFSRRMDALRADELLAVEPGGRDLEARRHQQFADFRLPPSPEGTEWFKPHPALGQHIAALALAYLPPVKPSVADPAPPGFDLGQIVADSAHLHSLTPAELAGMDTEELLAVVRRSHEVARQAPTAMRVILNELLQRGRTLTGLAETLGVSVSTVSRWGTR